MRLFSTALLAAVLCTSAPVLAQTAPVAAPAATNAPSGGTPEAIPFGIPYGTAITADHAAKVVAVVLAEARKHPAWRFSIAVVDPSGDLVYYYRMDDSQIGSIGVAQGKARTSARYRRETRAFYNTFEGGHAYIHTIDPTLVASPGGYPLIENGKIIGAIGCSGGTGDQDAAACAAGAASVK